MLTAGHKRFCVLGDVYRKDEVDATHYPAFHQMEALRLYKVSELKEYVSDSFVKSRVDKGLPVTPDIQNVQYNYFSDQAGGNSLQNQLIRRLIIDDLKQTHENLMKFLFTQSSDMRWNPDFFPFTEPSYELEVFLRERWLEVLGSGVVHKGVLENAGIDPNQYIGWASGVGLERLAMIMFDIPDIRLFWSTDERFLSQFTQDKISQFRPFSKYPSCFKDVSFYLPSSTAFEENEIHGIIRHHGGDLIEKVELVDFFENKKQSKTSRCFRIHYRSLERTLTNPEIDKIQFAIRDDFVKVLGVELR